MIFVDQELKSRLDFQIYFRFFYLYLLSILLFVIYTSSITLQSLFFCLFVFCCSEVSVL